MSEAAPVLEPDPEEPTDPDAGVGDTTTEEKETSAPGGLDTPDPPTQDEGPQPGSEPGAG